MGDVQQTPNQKKQIDKKWLAIGLVLGLAFGVARDKVGIGIAIGLGLGVALAYRYKLKK